MKYPKFYDSIESIQVQDPLSASLGAFENGVYTFTYKDCVMLAGHSCPTIAGAYLMCLEALKSLYPDGSAVRGAIEVSFKEDVEEGVTGVMANVISQITGATDRGGFKGMMGKHVRHSLMYFNVDMDGCIRFRRVDTKKSVEMDYDALSVLPNPEIQEIMQEMSKGTASAQRIQKFGSLWQERVERIFEHKDALVRLKEL